MNVYESAARRLDEHRPAVVLRIDRTPDGGALVLLRRLVGGRLETVRIEPEEVERD